MAIPAHSKKLPKWHFLTPAWNLKKKWSKCLHLKCYESAFSDFIQTLSLALSKCLSKWIKLDKWDPLQELKFFFCLGLLWIPRKTKAKLERPHFFKVQPGKITVGYLHNQLLNNRVEVHTLAHWFQCFTILITYYQTIGSKCIHFQ